MSRGRRDKPMHCSGAEPLPIGAEMRRARQNAGIALTTMATATSYSKSYLSTVENGVALPSVELVEVYETTLRLEKGKLTNVLHREKQSTAGQMAHSEPGHMERGEQGGDGISTVIEWTAADSIIVHIHIHIHIPCPGESAKKAEPAP
ncbi:MAG TPA: helix-turn-helix transcriptional regulator [Ktedonosporobacter sp.]|nr:helix-turn-helix transcriptional regulator [Ktedonosporobacter sp.]